MHLGSVSVVHLEMEEETTGNLTNFLKIVLVKQKIRSTSKPLKPDEKTKKSQT